MLINYLAIQVCDDVLTQFWAECVAIIRKRSGPENCLGRSV